MPLGPGSHVDPASSQWEPGTSSGGLLLPESLTSLSSVIRGLDARLESQAAVTQELANAVRLLAGKSQQTSRSNPTYTTRGNSAVPQIRGTFSRPGGMGEEQSLMADVVHDSGVPSVGGIRHHAAKFISERQFGPNVKGLKNPFTGKVEYHTVSPDGSTRPSTPQEINSSKRGNALKGAAGNMLTGGGLPGIEDVAAMLPEVAEPLGLAVGAVGAAYEVTNLVANQRAKNAQFQSVLGGSNASGFGQRLDEIGFRMSQLGVMGSAQAEEAFMGTTQLGLRGGERGNALSGIAAQYRELGMSVSQSLQALNVQLQAGNTNFQELTQSLSEVSDAASKAGINANTARTAFINTLSAGNQALGGGSGTTASAVGLSKAVSGLGQQFGLQGFNLNGIYSTQSLREIASANGMSYDQVIARGNSDPNWIDRAALGFLQNRTNSSFPALSKDLQTYLNGAGSNYKQAYEQGTLGTDWTNVANAVLKMPGAPDVQALQQMVTTLFPGMNVNNLTPQQLVQLLETSSSGKLAQSAGVKNPSATSNLTKSQDQRLAKAFTAPSNSTNPSFDVARQVNSALKNAGIHVGEIGGGTTQQEKMRIAYAQQIATHSGQNSGIIDQLLGGQGWKSEFQVKNAQGKMQNVNFSQLMANKNYQQQAEEGTAMIREGKTGAFQSTAAQFNGGNKVTVPPPSKVDVTMTIQPTAYFQKTIKTIQASMNPQASAHTLIPAPASTTPGS